MTALANECEDARQGGRSTDQWQRSRDEERARGRHLIEIDEALEVPHPVAERRIPMHGEGTVVARIDAKGIYADAYNTPVLDEQAAGLLADPREMKVPLWPM